MMVVIVSLGGRVVLFRVSILELYPLGLCDANAIERQIYHIWYACLAGCWQGLENIIVFDMMASALAHEDALATHS